ncbi:MULTISPECIES: hypothetical protein [unclassified Streptomyces]|uniref:hypothetical protein n=1 Tax=unclassified Streptomyces TaxID=2593676 RepID=UPI0022546A11|nr:MULTISPECIES: hypothetical protein [unclassified Streptomyces]MCX4409231.1 hypothetical protein [Streptomyces sp. NBC_01764]MCX5185243.1 hypothetical protein [Streptomyces sp. NBC_00268]
MAQHAPLVRPYVRPQDTDLVRAPGMDPVRPRGTDLVGPPGTDPVRPPGTVLVRPPGVDAPPICEVPQFAPVHVRGGRYRLRRLTRHKRRAVAAGLAVTAAALVAAGPGDAGRARGHPTGAPSTSASSPLSPYPSPLPSPRSSSSSLRGRGAVEMVAAPVRIADAATVRLLRPGDRVDVIAADGGSEGRVVAAGARVAEVPDFAATETGALVVLSVPRATAARLAGAGTTARLAVTLC